MRELTKIQAVLAALLLLVTGGILSRVLFSPSHDRLRPSPSVEQGDMQDIGNDLKPPGPAIPSKRQPRRPAEPSFAHPGEPIDPEQREAEQFELRVRAGLVSRDDVGDDVVDRILRDRARTILAELPPEAVLAWRAKQLGFSDPARLEEFENRLDSLDEVKKQEFAMLRAEVEDAIPVYQECRVAAFENGRNLEIIDPDDRHDSAQWVKNRGLDETSDSLIANTSDTRVGDRIFRLYFRSADYPQLESRIQRIRQLRSSLGD